MKNLTQELTELLARLPCYLEIGIISTDSNTAIVLTVTEDYQEMKYSEELLFLQRVLSQNILPLFLRHDSTNDSTSYHIEIESNLTHLELHQAIIARTSDYYIISHPELGPHFVTLETQEGIPLSNLELLSDSLIQANIFLTVLTSNTSIPKTQYLLTHFARDPEDTTLSRLLTNPKQKNPLLVRGAMTDIIYQ
jgi:hypothetical protein